MKLHMPAHTSLPPQRRLRAVVPGPRSARGPRNAVHGKLFNRSILLDCMQCLPDSLLVVDAQARLIFFNPAAWTLFSRLGWNTLADLSAYDLLLGWQRCDTAQLVLPQGSLRRREAWNCEALSPSQHRIRISCTPLPDHGQLRQAAYMLRFTDLTSDAIIMRVKDDHTRFITHDLRAPLSNIIALVEDAKLKGAGSDAFVRAVEQQAERGLSLTHNLLDLSKVASAAVEFSRVDVASIMLDSLSDAQPLADRRHIQLAWDRPTTSPCWIKADPALLKRVFDNVLDNAIKYSPPQSAVRCTLFCQGSQYLVDIVDQGLGMDSSQLQQLFKPYSRPHRHMSGIKGTGLGLLFVERAMQSWGAHVQVESHLGRGSRFRLIFTAFDFNAKAERLPV